MITFSSRFCCEADREIEVHCYSETWVMSISMVRYVPRVRAMLRVHCLGGITALKSFQLDFESCCDVRVSGSD